MKKLKFLLTTALLAMLAMQAQAQGIGIRGGVNFQNINGKDFLGNDLENDLITGFNVGVMGEAAIAPTFYFQSGLLYSVKGAQSSSDSFLGISGTNTVKTGYLEVPLHFVFKPALGNGHFFLGFGPYVNTTDWKVEFTKTVEPSDSDEAFYQKRFDAGGNLFFGYEFAGGLSFQLNTQLGMVEINPEYSGINEKSKWNNTGFGVSAMYRFGPKY
jgi:hypothetical protein